MKIKIINTTDEIKFYFYYNEDGVNIYELETDFYTMGNVNFIDLDVL
jgi:hypothetical protein